MAKKGKVALWILIVIVGLAILATPFVYFKFFWVFSDGTKTGELNSLTYTGYIWKTYEGEIILSGYGSKSGGSSVQSKIFKFSVADPQVAEKLSSMTGLRVTVHYKEYKGVLPWRGYEKAIVDHVDDDPVPSTLYDDESIFL